jgi:hypothetical protein
MSGVKFRAGRMTLSGAQLVPDARKGLVQLSQVWRHTRLNFKPA